MDSAIISAIITAALTALIALVVSLINSYKTTQLHISNSFVFTVTAERVKWIGNLRENISQFSSLIYDLYQLNGDDEILQVKKRHEIVVELKRLQTLIRLQLNPKAFWDQRISLILHEIFNEIERYPHVQVDPKMNELISATQAMLKEEWDRVKAETQEVKIDEILNYKERYNYNDVYQPEVAAASAMDSDDDEPKKADQV